MTEIKNIYLAGKIAPAPDNWREAIVDDLYDAVKSCFAQIYEGEQWPILEGSIFKRFNYTGPHFVRDDHALAVHGDDSHGTACNRDDEPGFLVDNHGMPTLGEERRRWTVESCKEAIEHSDVVFAWIDSTDCYGTIAEIGYAKALNKQVWIAGPKKFRDMWFIYEMADRTLFKYWTARSALQTFIEYWEKHNLRFNSPIEQSFWNDWESTKRSYNNERLQLLPQYPIGKYRVDFAHLPTRTAIELDGFASHSSTEDIARDRKRQREIEAMGWHVVRFGGKEIHNDVSECVKEVVYILTTRMERDGKAV